MHISDDNIIQSSAFDISLSDLNIVNSEKHSTLLMFKIGDSNDLTNIVNSTIHRDI